WTICFLTINTACVSVCLKYTSSAVQTARATVLRVSEVDCMQRFVKWAALFVFVLLIPAVSSAQQATIAGVVKDASGGVLPGVTVEASSPVLTEKVRSAVTDGTGQYRIVSLPPGSYTVTFTLQGFNTVKREGVELA